MKLKVNNDHKKCIFNNQNKTIKAIKVGGLFLGVSIFSGATFGTISYTKDLETVAFVSSDERKSIYKDNLVIDFDKYIENDQSDTDPYITVETLKDVKLLQLNMLYNHDLSILEKYPKLETLFLSNAQRLSIDDISFINNSSLKNIYLSFNYDEIRKSSKKSFNLECFSNKNIYINQESYDELYNVILLNYLENIPDNNSSKFLEYQQLDNNLDEILVSLDINSNDDELDKFLKILYYVTDHIKYDNEIKFFIKVNARLDKGSTYYNKVVDYNINSLSSVVNDKINSTQDGVCINYADLLTALCYKAGIEAYTFDSIPTDLRNAHAWNVVNIDDIYQYVDPTSIDNDDDISFYLYEYMNNKGDYYKSKVQRLVLNDIDDEYIENYLPSQDLNSILTEPNKNVSIYNKDIDGTKVHNKDFNYLPPIVFGLYSGLFVVLIDSTLIKEKKDKTLTKKR